MINFALEDFFPYIYIVMFSFLFLVSQRKLNFLAIKRKEQLSSGKKPVRVDDNEEVDAKRNIRNACET